MVSDEVKQYDAIGYVPSNDLLTEEQYRKECEIRQELESYITGDVKKMLERILQEPLKEQARIVQALDLPSYFPEDARGVYEDFTEKFLSLPLFAVCLQNRDYLNVIMHMSSLGCTPAHNEIGGISYLSKQNVSLPYIIINFEKPKHLIVDALMYNNVHRIQCQFKQFKNISYDELIAVNWGNEEIRQNVSRNVNGSFESTFNKTSSLIEKGLDQGINMWYFLSRSTQQEFDWLSLDRPLDEQINQLVDANPCIRLQIIKDNLEI